MSSGPTPYPEVVEVVERGATGLSAFAAWRIDRGDPTLTEQDFYNYIASLVPSGGGGGGGYAQQQYNLLSVSSYNASHAFPYKPSVLLLDALGQEVETDVFHTTGQVRLVFPTPFTGVLYLG